MKTRSSSQPVLSAHLTIQQSLGLMQNPHPSGSDSNRVHPQPPLTPVSTLSNSKLFMAAITSSDTNISGKHQLIDELITYLQLHHAKSLDKLFKPSKLKFKHQEEQLEYWQEAALEIMKKSAGQCGGFFGSKPLNADLEPFYTMLCELDKLSLESLQQRITENFPGFKSKLLKAEQKPDKPLATSLSNQ